MKGWTEAVKGIKDIEFKDDVSWGGMRRFIGPSSVISQISNLDPNFINEGHNDSPTPKEILEIQEKLGVPIRVYGYVIGPEREDERVSIDGIYVGQASLLNPKDFCFLYSLCQDEMDYNEESDEIWMWWD